MTRRGALVAGIGFAAGAAGGAFMGRTTGAPASKPGGEAIDPRHGRWVDVAALSDLTEGQGHQVMAGGDSALLFFLGRTLSAPSPLLSPLPLRLSWSPNHPPPALPHPPPAR